MPRSDRIIRDRLESLQREARTRPRLHAFRLFLVVALGYAYPFVLLALIFGAIIAALLPARWVWEEGDPRGVILYVAAMIGLVALAVVVMRAIWPKIPPPAGNALGPADAQPLREM